MSAVAVAVSPSLRLLLCGLDPEVAAGLKDLLPLCQWVFEPDPPADEEGCRALFATARPNVVFCPAEFAHRNAFLAAARDASIPVVVLSRLPDARDWLNAMDAGAADYVVPPLDLRQLHWILQSSLRPAYS
ncbi:MAG: response regulator [Acidobacteria bacterium]|nr:response regulator [Acidobacteriota bacterium]